LLVLEERERTVDTSPAVGARLLDDRSFLAELRGVSLGDHPKEEGKKRQRRREREAGKDWGINGEKREGREEGGRGREEGEGELELPPSLSSVWSFT